MAGLSQKDSLPSTMMKIIMMMSIDIINCR